MNSSPRTLATLPGQGKPGNPPGARPRRGARRRASGGRAFAYGARLGSARRNNMEQPPCGPTTRRDKQRGRVLCRPGRGPAGGLGVPIAETSSRDVERHLASGEGARAGAGGGAVPAR